MRPSRSIHAPLIYTQEFLTLTLLVDAAGIPGAYVTCQYAASLGGVIYVLCGTVDSSQGVHSHMLGHLVPRRHIDTVCTYNPVLNEWNTVFR